MRPESKGSIHIKTGDASQPPAIRFNFLSESIDRECLLAAMRITRRLMDAPAMAWIEPKELPRREWVYGRHLVRGFVSCTIAPGGIGKTALLCAEALAMVTGRPLLGDAPQGRLRVWLVNLEDPIDELRRRIAATAPRSSAAAAPVSSAV